MTARCQGSRRLPRSRVLHRSLSERVEYLLRLPAVPNDRRVLVAVHGISRNAGMIVRGLADEAERAGYAILAPCFSPRHFDDYQRLGRRGRGARADQALLAMLEDAGVKAGRFDLFGFSGGAQFAHRFVAAHPGVAASMALAAAGWYTDPGSQRRFPRGLGATDRLEGLRFSARALVDTPSLVMAGTADTERDPALRCTPALDARQGRHRLARARWFHARLRTLASQQRHHFVALPETGHDFTQAVVRGGLAKHLFDFLNSQQLERLQSLKESS